MGKLRRTLVSWIPRNIRLRRRALRERWLGKRGFVLSPAHYHAPVSAQMLEYVQLRHGQRPPCLFVHGIQQRSGTNFVGDLLNLHQDIHGFPAKTWEIPLLQKINHLVGFQEHYIRRFSRNAHFIDRIDFVPLMANSLIDYLSTQAPEGKTLLFKDPSVANIELFHKAFPRDHLLLVVRDGRDVISSRLRTWPNIEFEDAVHDWHQAAQTVLGFLEHYQEGDKVLFERYEEIAQDPEAFIERVVEKFSLAREHYPFEQATRLPLKGSSRVRGSHQSVHWGEEQKPEDFRPSGNWSHWTPKQVRYFNRVAGASSEALGYGI